MNLSDWIKSARKYAKLTQSQLGDALGKSKSNISLWESGYHEPSYNQILKIIAITRFSTPPPGLENLIAQNWRFRDLSEEKFKNLTERDVVKLETALLLAATNLGIDLKK